MLSAATPLIAQETVLVTHKMAVFATLLAAIVAMAGCSFPERGTPVPQADTARALPLGIPNARFFADGDPKPMIEEGMRALEREEAALRVAGNARPGQGGVKLPPVNYLAVSGGGDNGAFGAGFLNGWRESGRRPQFDVVGGVSTGALLATHAFLGTPADDATLEEMYTKITSADIYTDRGILSLLSADSLRDTAPLRAMLAKYITAETLKRVAAAYDENRMLVVGTTNIDYGQTWVWNMTAIAKAGKLELYRDVLLASASFPIVFPPVEIDDHLFVDGAARSNLVVPGMGGQQKPNDLPLRNSSTWS